VSTKSGQDPQEPPWAASDRGNAAGGWPFNKALDVIGNQRGSSNNFSAHLPFLWGQRRRGNAPGRLRVLLRVSWLWDAAQTEQGALLRVLLIRNGAVSASAGIGPMLWRQQMDI
jgi:hypothetical protein